MKSSARVVDAPDWLRFEREVAAKLRKAGIPSIRTPLSGTFIKGDVRTPDLLIECKYSRSRWTARIHRSKLKRTIHNAQEEGKLPVLAFKMPGDPQVYVILRMEDFISLTSAYKGMKKLNAFIFIMGVIHEEVGTEKAFTFRGIFGRDRHA